MGKTLSLITSSGACHDVKAFAYFLNVNFMESARVIMKASLSEAK